MPAAREHPEGTYQPLNDALDGLVTVDIGQITKGERRLLDRAVRAGKLAKWRGKWFPHAGAPIGIGPDKTCWSTPDVAAYFADFRRGVEARLIQPTTTGRDR